jgi:hypothetical protein
MFAGMTIMFLFALKWKTLTDVVLAVAVEFVSFSYCALSDLPCGSAINASASNTLL